jgi:hypothetical protein
MKVLTANKALICLFSVGTIVLAGTFKDYNSTNVIVENSETIENEIIPVERSIASEIALKVAQMNLPADAENIKKINGAWEITRKVGSDKLVSYDKNSNAEDANQSIQIQLDLIGNGIVRLDNKIEQVYRISLLSNFGTIAIFKQLGDGFEIIEAKRIVSEKEESAQLVVEQEVELILERAVNQSKSNELLEGQNAIGQVSLTSKSISGLSVELRNSNGESQNIEIDNANLLDGGYFTAEVNGEEVSGVVFNNGAEGYRISFVTGPIAGAMLNFATKEQMEINQDAEQEENNNIEVNAENNQQAQDASMQERKDVANEESSEVLTVEQVKETAEARGFAF